MGRKRKFDHGQKRSYILAPEMTAQLKQAARLRGAEVSDVLRHLIAAGMDLYLRESRAIYRQRVHAAIEGVKKNTVLAEFYDRLKDQPDAALPLNAPLNKSQKERLTLAVQGHQALGATLSENAEREGLPLLERLVVRASGLIRRWLLELWDLVERREIYLGEQGSGQVFVQLIGPLTGPQRARGLKEAAVAAWHRLIDYRVLRKPRWPPPDLVYFLRMEFFRPAR
jgi:hypothetical protein